METDGKVFRIGTVLYNWPMSAHASQAFSIAHFTDLEDLPLTVGLWLSRPTGYGRWVGGTYSDSRAGSYLWKSQILLHPPEFVWTLAWSTKFCNLPYKINRSKKYHCWISQVKTLIHAENDNINNIQRKEYLTDRMLELGLLQVLNDRLLIEYSSSIFVLLQSQTAERLPYCSSWVPLPAASGR